MKRMKLKDIKISAGFVNSTPSKKKMCECREFWRYEHKQDRPIVLNHKGVLIDGYVMYKVLMEHKEEYADVIQYKRKRHNKGYEKKLPRIKLSYKNTPTTYVFGTHPNNNCVTTYVWRVPLAWDNWVENVEIGDTIYCETKFGISPVIVQEVEFLSKPPVAFKVKRVASKYIKKNNEINN